MFFFFDLADGSREPDLSGTDLPDRDAAEREAIRFLGEVLKHEPRRLDEGRLTVDVREETGGIPFTVCVTVARSEG